MLVPQLATMESEEGKKAKNKWPNVAENLEGHDRLQAKNQKRHKINECYDLCWLLRASTLIIIQMHPISHKLQSFT